MKLRILAAVVLTFASVCVAQTTSTAPADTKAQAVQWLDRAAEESNAIDSEEPRLEMLSSIAQIWARMGDVEHFNAALDQIHALKSDDPAGLARAEMTARYSGTVELLPRLVRDGKIDVAHQLIDAITKVDEADYHFGAQEMLAGAMAEAGHEAEAQKMVEDAPDDESSAKLEQGIGFGLARAGKVEGALQAAKNIKPALRSIIYVSLVGSLARHGDFEGAKKLMDQLPAENHAELCREIFEVQLRAKDFKGARQTLDLMDKNSGTDRLLLDICFAQTQAGDIAGARATALDMAGTSQEGSGLNLVALEMIKAGNEQQARDLLEQIKPKDRARAENELRQDMVMGSASADDGKRAAAHLEEMPMKERNFTFYLVVAQAEGKSHDMAAYQKYLALAKAEADGEKMKASRVNWYRQMVVAMTAVGDVDAAIKLAGELPTPKEQSQVMAGVAIGCGESDLPRAFKLAAAIETPNLRANAAANLAVKAAQQGKLDQLDGWIKLLPTAEDRALAARSAAETLVSYPGI